MWVPVGYFHYVEVKGFEVMEVPEARGTVEGVGVVLRVPDEGAGEELESCLRIDIRENLPSGFDR